MDEISERRIGADNRMDFPQSKRDVGGGQQYANCKYQLWASPFLCGRVKLVY